MLRTVLLVGCQRLVRHYRTKTVLCKAANLSLLRNEGTPVQTSFRYFSSEPPHIKVRLPALSPTMEMGTIVSWEKKEGDTLNEGDLLCEIETDKAVMGFETPEEGFLAKILVAAGTKDVPLGKLLCIIVSNESDIASFKDFQDTGSSADVGAKPAGASAPPMPSTPTPPPVSPQVASAAVTRAQNDHVFASPLAKKLAGERNIDLSTLRGSGPGGRITERDLSQAPLASAAGVSGTPATKVAQAQPSTVYQDIELSNMRQTIAKRLLQSKQSIPHYQLTTEIRMDSLLSLRSELNASLEKEKITVNDFIVKAAALACKAVPEANSAFMDTFIRQYNSVDICVAVATSEGLITPIVFDAEKKGLSAISRETKELANLAREKRLLPHQFQGGTFTISNLGMMGISHFSAIINPPQSCILAVGRTASVVIPDDENVNGVGTAQMMNVTLSCDHRVVDGAVGARWLQSFKGYLERPHTMLL